MKHDIGDNLVVECDIVPGLAAGQYCEDSPTVLCGVKSDTIQIGEECKIMVFADGKLIMHLFDDSVGVMINLRQMIPIALSEVLKVKK